MIKSSPVIGIVGCVHGNEILGKEVIDLLKKVPVKNGTIFFILGNVAAMNENKRFLDSDLNRCFPGDENGDREERIASFLVEELEKCDYVIDIHSTSAETENFIVITKNSSKGLAKFIPLKKIVKMGEDIAKGRSLIDHVTCGVSLEFDIRSSVEFVKEVILDCFRNLGVIEGESKIIDQEEYLCYGVLKEGDNFTNFEEVSFEGEVFYPVLFGEKEYDFVCLKAKRI